MRIVSSVILASVLCLAAPAWAGNVTMSNGQVAWQSTQCPAPQVPAALASIDSESSAESVNQLAVLHNAYAAQAQAYMDCMSNEAQNDANLTAKGVVASAQAAIQQVQAGVDAQTAALSRPQ